METTLDSVTSKISFNTIIRFQWSFPMGIKDTNIPQKTKKDKGLETQVSLDFFLARSFS